MGSVLKSEPFMQIIIKYTDSFFNNHFSNQVIYADLNRSKINEEFLFKFKRMEKEAKENLRTFSKWKLLK